MDDGREVPAAAAPPPETLRAFREQATEELLRAAERYARDRAKLVRRAGRRIDHLYARELVQDALTDTWTGGLRWDPERRSLLDHVRYVVRQRSWDDVMRVRRFRPVSLHADGNAAKRERLEAEISDVHASQGDLSPILVASLTAAVVTELRRLAVRDVHADAILKCWAAGVVQRQDVLARTGLTATEYHLGRRRIRKLVSLLPPHLRDTSKDLLRSAS